jgi:hypothetical protein
MLSTASSGIDGEGRVYQPPVALEDARHEAVRDALYKVLPHLPTHYGRGLRGLHSEEPDPGVDLAEGLPDPHERAARTHAHDQRVGNDPLWELRQDLGSQDLAVLLDVPLRLELGRAKVAWFRPSSLAFSRAASTWKWPTWSTSAP